MEVPIEELIGLARRVLQNVDDDEEVLIAMRDACGMQRLRDQARGRCLAALDRARRA
jgi:hypothetical protein